MTAASFRHQVKVRYADCDMQRVVYNAHYLTYADEACEALFRSVGFGSSGASGEWDFMLKRAEIDWSGPATYGDLVDIDVRVARWGNTSFTLVYQGTVDDLAVFDAAITYVGVRLGTTETVPVPQAVRDALGSP